MRTTRYPPPNPIELTQQQCEVWSANPLINPKTGRSINENGPTYNVIREACAKYNITAGVAAAAIQAPPTAIPLTKTTSAIPRRKLPRYVGTIEMPQSKNKWVYQHNTFHNIFTICDTFQVVAHSTVFYALPYAEICDIAIDFGFVKGDAVALVREWATRFRELKNNHSAVTVVEDTYMNQNFFDGQYVNVENEITSLNRLVLQGETSSLNGRIKQVVAQVRILNYMYVLRLNSNMLNVNLITEEQIDFIKNVNYNKMLEYLFEELNDIQRMQNEIKAAQAKTSIKADTRSRPLPASISIEKIMRRIPIPKRTVPTQLENGEMVMKIDHAAPDEFREVEDVLEPSSERNSFRRHSAMSHMTPFSPSSHLDPLPVKTRVQLLNELRLACSYMKDGISGKRFDRMHKKGLHLVVQLGDTPGKKRCFYVRNIYKLWEHTAKAKHEFLVPETRAIVTKAEKADILNKMKYIERNVKESPNYNKGIPNIDPKLKLIITPIDEYYKLSIERRFGTMIYLIDELGYVPSDIESVDGDSNISSTTLVGSIQGLFYNGKLMESNFAPYSCCKVHLNKTMEYWGTGAERKNRLRHMLDEMARVA
jgi:hypothetical protein